MTYINLKTVNNSLAQLKLSPSFLTASLIFLSIVLILLFIFIFLGIKAFTVGTTFGSIINSIIPIGYKLFFYLLK